MGGALRPGSFPSVRGALLLDLTQSADDVWAGGIEVGGSPRRWLHMNHARGFWELHGAVDAGWSPRPYVRVDAQLGAEFIAFRQQFVPIDELFVPFVGAAAEVRVSQGIGSLGLRARLRADLFSTRLYDDQGASFILHPLEAGLDLVVRISGRGDPAATLRTLPKQ